VRAPRELRVELRGERRIVFAGGEQRVGPVADRDERAQVGVRRTLARELDDAQLEDHPRLRDVGGADVGEREHVRDPLADELRRRRRDEGAAARAHAHLHETVRLEHAEGIPERDAADAELARELALGRELVAGCEAPVADRRLDLLHDLAGNAPGRDRREGDPAHGLMVRQLW
jgi:hypothetical protein